MDRSPATPLLAAARQGDEHAFAQLLDPHRRELQAHCYRMLGSVQDAEDAVQDTLVGAWRGLGRFQGRSSLRSWLFTIATNASLKLIARRARRVLPMDFGPASPGDADPGEPLVESVWLEPYSAAGIAREAASPHARYEQLESLELAFVALVQHLPARQRAVLLLREVLGFSAAEVAQSLATTVPSVNSALQRARATIDARLPQQSQQATTRGLGADGARAVVDGYMDAWERGDMDAVVARLTEDAVLAMPPTTTWYQGRAAIATFYQRVPLSAGVRWRHAATTVNGQAAVGCYAWSAERTDFQPVVLDVLTLRDTMVEQVTAYLYPERFESYGLPAALPARG